MKLSCFATLLLAFGFAAWGQQPMPRMVSVDPPNAKAGDMITVSGENLQKAAVSKVYLTDAKNDVECTITEQTDTAIKLKVPAKATGRMALMVLTAGKDAKLIEQPVKLQVEQ